jgi:hypothetical protein
MQPSLPQDKKVRHYEKIAATALYQFFVSQSIEKAEQGRAKKSTNKCIDSAAYSLVRCKLIMAYPEHLDTFRNRIEQRTPDEILAISHKVLLHQGYDIKPIEGYLKPRSIQKIIAKENALALKTWNVIKGTIGAIAQDPQAYKNPKENIAALFLVSGKLMTQYANIKIDDKPFFEHVSYPQSLLSEIIEDAYDIASEIIEKE